MHVKWQCDSFWENSGPRVAESGGHDGTGCAGEGAAQRVAEFDKGRGKRLGHRL